MRTISNSGNHCVRFDTRAVVEKNAAGSDCFDALVQHEFHAAIAEFARGVFAEFLSECWQQVILAVHEMDLEILLADVRIKVVDVPNVVGDLSRSFDTGITAADHAETWRGAAAVRYRVRGLPLQGG